MNNNQSEQQNIEARFLRRLTAALISLARELQDDEEAKGITVPTDFPVSEKKGERQAC